MTAAAKPEDNKPVDMDAITARLDKMSGELNDEKVARARVEGQLSTLQNAPAVPAAAAPANTSKKVYTSDELSQAVRDGHITQMQSEQIAREQDKDELRSEMKSQAEQTQAETIATITLNAKKQAYIDAFPDSLIEGTDDRARLVAAYNEMVSDGSPDNAATEIAAMTLAFGPPPNTIPRDKTAEARETDASGGGGAPDVATDAGGDDPSAGIKMTRRQRDHYTGLVASGAYTWEQANSEMSGYEPGGGRARQGKPYKPRVATA